jgi:acyl carrier protein
MERQEVYEKVSALLTDYLRLKPGEVAEGSHVINDLGADSLAIAELGFKFMETFDIGMIAADDQQLVVGKLVDHITGLTKA